MYAQVIACISPAYIIKSFCIIGIDLLIGISRYTLQLSVIIAVNQCLSSCYLDGKGSHAGGFSGSCINNVFFFYGYIYDSGQLIHQQITFITQFIGYADTVHLDGVDFFIQGCNLLCNTVDFIYLDLDLVIYIGLHGFEVII